MLYVSYVLKIRCHICMYICLSLVVTDGPLGLVFINKLQTSLHRNLKEKPEMSNRKQSIAVSTLKKGHA